MIRTKIVFDALKSKGVRFYTGVPDSLLKDFCAYISDHSVKGSHVIAANEGNAVSLAAGHHLATGKIGVIYLQNSGLGNAINPLLSLADSGVYSIPMLLVVGWRGEPGVKDEPQHLTQGPLTIPLFEALRIPYEILPQEEGEAIATLRRLYGRAKQESRPVALLVREGTFDSYGLKKQSQTPYPLTREAALQLSAASLGKNAVVVSTTGKLSRELFELRKESGGRHEKDFLTVGSMGHASQIALGIALAQPARPVYCFDGDGAAIMHLGGWTVIGQTAPKNFKHIIFNNGVHDSVGGQPTSGFGVDFVSIARASGYRHAESVSTAIALKKALLRLKKVTGPAFLEIRIRSGSRTNLSRPTRTPLQNKRALMKYLKHSPRS